MTDKRKSFKNPIKLNFTGVSPESNTTRGRINYPDVR